MSTQAEIADHLGITQPQVSEHQRKGLYPPGCSLDQARLAYIAHLREIAAGRGGPDAQARLTEQRAAQAEADTKLKELEFFKRVGALVPVEETESALCGWAATARSEVENSVDRMIHDVESRHGVTVDRDQVEDILKHAYKAIADYPRIRGLAEDAGNADGGNPTTTETEE